MSENAKKIIKYLGWTYTVIMNLFYPGVIFYCIFPEHFPFGPAETVLSWYGVFAVGWAFFAAALSFVNFFTLKTMQMSVDQLRNSPVFKDVPEAPQKPISLSFWYNLLITTASAFCLIVFKSFYWTGGAVIFSLAVLNIGGFLIERKRANLALKYNANKEIADAQLEKYREI